MALGFLWGWDYVNTCWRKLKVNDEGKVYVTGAGKTAGRALIYEQARMALPAGGTVFLDTGQLSAGEYNITAHFMLTIDSSWSEVSFEHRNAANDTSLFSMDLRKYYQYYDIVESHYLGNYIINANERLRWYVKTRGSTGGGQADIILTPLT